MNWEENNNNVGIETESLPGESMVARVEPIEISEPSFSLMKEIESDEAFLRELGISTGTDERAPVLENTGNTEEFLHSETATYLLNDPEPEIIMDKLRSMDKISLDQCIAEIESNNVDEVRSIFESGDSVHESTLSTNNIQTDTEPFRYAQLEEILKPVAELDMKTKEESKESVEDDGNSGMNGVGDESQVSERNVEDREQKEKIKVTEAKALLYHKNPEEMFLSSRVLLCRVNSNWDLFSGTHDLDNPDSDPAEKIKMAAKVILQTDASIEKEVGVEQKESKSQDNSKIFQISTHYLLGEADTEAVIDGNPNFQWFSITEVGNLQLTEKAETMIKDALDTFKEKDKAQQKI